LLHLVPLNKMAKPVSRKINKPLLIAFIFLGVIGSIYFYSKNLPANKYFYKSLNTHLKENKTHIPIANLTNFDWENMHFIGSYSGFKDYKDNVCGANNHDGTWALAFTKKKALVACIKGKKLSFERSLKSNSQFSIKSILVISGKMFTIKEG